MIRALPANYDEFKSAFDALGGSRKTAVIYQTQSGSFRIVAAFPADGIALAAGISTGISTTPSTLATDFPQAVALTNVDVT